MNEITIAKVLPIIASLLLVGCGTGTKISDEGSTDKPKWHKPDSVIFNKDKGTFPNLQSLIQVRSGMTKDQLYELLGRPQYDDGWRPREWNYLFHFTTPGVGKDDITTCQFKVLFDKDTYARSFYWNPVEPKDGVCPPNGKPQVKQFTLSGDALFRFDRSTKNDMNPSGKASIDQLIIELKKIGKVHRITVEGHTDRLGSVDYNLKLSQARAETVKQYLIDNGVQAKSYAAIGKGKQYQVKECSDALPRRKLIACLHPNRRVTINVEFVAP